MRAILIARVVVLAVLVAGFFVALRPEAPLAFERVIDGENAVKYLAGLAVFAATTVTLAVTWIWLRERLGRILWVALPLDLAASALFVMATEYFSDPFYPWFIALAVLYALMTTGRMAEVVSGLTALTYLLAHVNEHFEVGGSIREFGYFGFLGVKTVAIFAIAMLVSVAWTRVQSHNAELEASSARAEGLNRQLTRSLNELRAVSQITDIIHSSLEFDRIGPIVLETLQKAFDLPSCSIMIVDRDKGATVFEATRGQGADAALGRAAGQVIAGGRPAGSRHGDDTFSCITLLDQPRFVVVLCAPADDVAAMTDDDRLVLQAVASELVVAVENSQLYRLTKTMAVTDELTGLFNYRHLQSRLSEEFERAERYNRTLSLLMLDVDKFKEFNDTYGHTVGDQALAEVAHVLRGAVREVDVVARYGGEEFAVILPETDATGAFVAAEKIREAVARHRFRPRVVGEEAIGDVPVEVTVSVGVATYPVHALDRESLLRQADEALYQAKNSGRDRVRVPVPMRDGGTDTTPPLQADLAHIKDSAKGAAS